MLLVTVLKTSGSPGGSLLELPLCVAVLLTDMLRVVFGAHDPQVAQNTTGPCEEPVDTHLGHIFPRVGLGYLDSPGVTVECFLVYLYSSGAQLKNGKSKCILRTMILLPTRSLWSAP